MPQTLTSTHHFSVQTRRRSYLRPKLSGPKLVERKNTKLSHLAKFLFKKTFLKGSEMTSADSKLTRKRFYTIKFNSADHLETSIPTENFSIGAIFGPKTACEVERFSKMMKILDFLGEISSIFIILENRSTSHAVFGPNIAPMEKFSARMKVSK